MSSQENSEENHSAIVRDFQTALSRNDKELIRQLINSNDTLLHYAAKENLPKIVEQMIKYGADVNATDSNGITPLHVASQYASKEAVSILLQNGAMYDAVDDLETKAVDVAKNNEIAEILQSTETLFASVLGNDVGGVGKICQDGAILEAKDSEGNTALHNAAWQGFQKIVNKLLEHHANINARSCHGRTPLHYAVHKSHEKMVELLLFHGALFDPVDDNGKTPSDLCKKKVLSDLFRMIRACFKKIHDDDATVIDHITKIASFDTKKAVLGAKNSEGRTLTVEAIRREFSKLDEFEKKLQPYVYDRINKGKGLFRKDKSDAALKILIPAWEERERLLGPANPFTLDVQFLISGTLLTSGRPQESLNISQRLCEKQSEIYGYDAVETLRTRSGIVEALGCLGKNDVAFEMQMQINKVRDELCGSYYKFNSLVLKANDLEMQQKHDEAIGIFWIFYNELITKLKGLESNQTILALNAIGMIQFRQGKYEKSFESLIDVLMKQLRSYRPEMFKTLMEIDFLLAKMGTDAKGATAAWKEVLCAKLKVADKLGKRNMPLDALKLLREVSTPLKTTFGAKHLKVKECAHAIEDANEKLRSMGIDESQVLERNNVELKTAVIGSNFDDVSRILNRDGSPNINAKDEERRTLLHFAVGNGHLNIVKALVARGAYVTTPTSDGRTPLHTAVANGSIDIVKILLRQAMSLGLYDYIDAQTTSMAATALHFAAETGQLEIVKLLLAYGAAYGVPNKDGRKPIDLATDEKVRDFLKSIGELFQVGRGDGLVGSLKSYMFYAMAELGIS